VLIPSHSDIGPLIGRNTRILIRHYGCNRVHDLINLIVTSLLIKHSFLSY
jgi:hypothetical protein